MDILDNRSLVSATDTVNSEDLNERIQELIRQHYQGKKMPQSLRSSWHTRSGSATKRGHLDHLLGSENLARSSFFEDLVHEEEEHDYSQSSEAQSPPKQSLKLANSMVVDEEEKDTAAVSGIEAEIVASFCKDNENDDVLSGSLPTFRLPEKEDLEIITQQQQQQQQQQQLQPKEEQQLNISIQSIEQQLQHAIIEIDTKSLQAIKQLIKPIEIVRQIALALVFLVRDWRKIPDSENIFEADWKRIQSFFASPARILNELQQIPSMITLNQLSSTSIEACISIVMNLIETHPEVRIPENPSLQSSMQSLFQYLKCLTAFLTAKSSPPPPPPPPHDSPNMSRNSLIPPPSIITQSHSQNLNEILQNRRAGSSTTTTTITTQNLEMPLQLEDLNSFYYHTSTSRTQMSQFSPSSASIQYDQPNSQFQYNLQYQHQQHQHQYETINHFQMPSTSPNAFKRKPPSTTRESSRSKSTRNHSNSLKNMSTAATTITREDTTQSSRTNRQNTLRKSSSSHERQKYTTSTPKFDRNHQFPHQTQRHSFNQPYNTHHLRQQSEEIFQYPPGLQNYQQQDNHQIHHQQQQQKQQQQLHHQQQQQSQQQRTDLKSRNEAAAETRVSRLDRILNLKVKKPNVESLVKYSLHSRPPSSNPNSKKASMTLTPVTASSQPEKLPLPPKKQQQQNSRGNNSKRSLSPATQTPLSHSINKPSAQDSIEVSAMKDRLWETQERERLQVFLKSQREKETKIIREMRQGSIELMRAAKEIKNQSIRSTHKRSSISYLPSHTPSEVSYISRGSQEGSQTGSRTLTTAKQSICADSDDEQSMNDRKKHEVESNSFDESFKQKTTQNSNSLASTSNAEELSKYLSIPQQEDSIKQESSVQHQSQHNHQHKDHKKRMHNLEDSLNRTIDVISNYRRISNHAASHY